MRKILYFIMLSFALSMQSPCSAHRHDSPSQPNASPSQLNDSTSQLKDSASRSKVDESEIFSDPYQHPYYLNGENKGLLNDLYSTLLKTAPITKDSVAARAIVKFDITKEGKIDPNSIKVMRNRSVPEDYLNAAIEAIKTLGPFEPGKMNNIPQKVSMNLPILYPIPLDRIQPTE